MPRGCLAAQGYGVMLPEYRGYGGNPGRRTNRACTAMARPR